MRRVVVGTNLVGGGAAAVLLVVLVFVLGVPLWLAVGLALAAFAGIALLVPADSRGAAISTERAARRDALQRGATEVAELRRLARQVPDDSVRARVSAIGDSADRVLAVLADEGRDAEGARAFLDRYLVPTHRLLAQYVRLADRGVAAAGPALAKIEEQDLPLLDRKLRELYEGLHRGDVIDLEVASEMLEFDLAGVEPAPPRRLDG